MNASLSSADIENVGARPRPLHFKRRAFGRSISNIPVQNVNEVPGKQTRVPLREINSKEINLINISSNATLTKECYSRKSSCSRLREAFKSSNSFYTPSIPKTARTEYEEEIEEHLFRTEQGNGASFERTEVTEKMRGILVDWLVDVHLRFKLRPETLFLTANIIDRYLQIATVTKQKLQLLGVTAMFIACKYEEIYAPEIKNFAYITDNSYTKDEILLMEQQVLKALNFNVTIPSSYQFLQRFVQHLDCRNKKVESMAQYLIELALLDCKISACKPSMVAAAALYIANRLVTRDKGWNAKMAKRTRYADSELKGTIKELMLLIQLAGKSSLKAVKNKFAEPKFMEVSKLTLKRKIK
eukprot:TRINITY_DN9671_c0_g3_i2.p1 TRINITY_DN9671_c0_g3~~TRINITY_DN9671_c0_g3_i2.p1  ORF type:complete len:357 (-),score=91.22 TRINITY_DN9671_c0_g3_i2:1000-2070(-)